MDKLIMKISVVISVYSIDRSSLLDDCICSLLDQSISPDEIIVVVDPNNDLYNYYKNNLPTSIRLIKSEEKGLAHARNSGIINSEGEIIAFIDDDAKADRNWIKNIIKHYDDENVVAVGGPIFPIWNDYKPHWFPDELDWVIGCNYTSYKTLGTVRNLTGCNMSFRKKVLVDVGLFNTNFGRKGKDLLSGEEPELCLRIKQNDANSKILFDPNVITYHDIELKRKNVNYLLKRSYKEGLSKSLLNKQFNKSGTLNNEQTYLKLLLNSILKKLNIFSKDRNLTHVFILLLCIASVFAGYFYGMLIKT